MKVNNLRVGNWVIDYEAEPNKTIYWQVETIEYLNTTLGIRFRDGSCWTCEEFIEPIPLTEEWIVKFGINETKDQDIYRINYVSYHKGTNTFNYCLGYYYDDQGYVDNIFKEIKHVHQLQNLYFELTGQELTTHLLH
jgi:hypothetical protein